jgi:hypothetical protein
MYTILILLDLVYNFYLKHFSISSIIAYVSLEGRIIYDYVVLYAE